MDQLRFFQGHEKKKQALLNKLGDKCDAERQRGKEMDSIYWGGYHVGRADAFNTCIALVKELI